MARLPLIGGGGIDSSLDAQLLRLGAVRAAPTVNTGLKTVTSIGREMLPSSTNVFRDTQVANALGGSFWAAAPTDCTITPNFDVPVSFGYNGPTKCGKVVFAYAGTPRVWESCAEAVTANKVWTPQCQVYPEAVAAGATIGVDVVVMNGGTEVRTVNLGSIANPAATAIRYAAGVTIAASGETHVKYRYTMAGANLTFYVSGHMVEQRTYLTPWGDGTLADWTWSGTAFQSTSSRSASAASYTIPQAPEGTVLMVARKYWSYAISNSDLTLPTSHFAITGGTKTVDSFSYQGNIRGPRLFDTAYRYDSYTHASAQDYADEVYCFRWSDAAGKLKLSIGLLNPATGIYTVYGSGALSTGVSFAAGTLAGNIGTTLALTSYLGAFRNVLFSPTCKSDAWRDAVLGSAGAAAYGPLALFTTYMAANDKLVPFTPETGSYIYTKAA